LGFAIIAAFTATVIALLASLKQTRIPGVDLLLSSSLAISLITLGFGYLLGFGSGLFWLIAIGHAVLTFPFAHRVIYHSLVKIDQSSLDAAITLGASKWMLFRTIIFPRIKYALLVAVVFAFAISLGELGFVLMLYDGIYATMPVYIYRLLSTFDLFAAAAMGVLLIAISFLCFYMIERLSKKEKVVW
jgi:ABC-type Fe3+ transport system permease subunit